jgi:molybdopterin molybdotransferase
VDTFISLNEARRIEQRAAPLQPQETVPLSKSLGRTLAEDAVGQEAIPPFDNSAMDGYAVRTADLDELPATLEIVEEIPAGTTPDRPIEAGMCAQIMTGAPVPEGADAIVPVEWTDAETGGTVRINQRPEPRQYIRPAGQDVQRGDVMVEAGQVVTPPVVGMLATLGISAVPVRLSPTVAVIATGDELVPVEAELAPGQIRNSNGPALAAQVQAAGGTPLGPLLARDDDADIRRVVEEALRADVIVFSGGVSVGEHDHVKRVLDAMGMELHFWKVRQRPGKPLAFGTLQGALVFGLPGNPVSSAMCFEQHVRPVLATMLGRQRITRPRHPAVLDAPSPKVENLHHFARGIASFDEQGRLRVRDTGPQASNLYSSVVRANCIIHLPEGLPDAEPGLEVDIEWLNGELTAW